MPKQHYALMLAVVLMVLTVSLSMLSMWYADKTNTVLIKRIVFAIMVVMSMETVLIVLIARQALSEALLAGFFPLAMGFMLLLHIDVFD
jgi:hypothetical protein